MPSVVCAGVITADLIFLVDEAPDRPRKYRAVDSTLISGGCALNAAVAIARLGGEAHLAGVIGADIFGELVLDELNAEGVGAELLFRTEGIATSRSAVLVGPDGERTIVNHRDPNLFEAVPVLPAPFPYGAALADTRWPRGAELILRGARDAGRPAVLDAEMPIAPAAGALEAASHIAFSEQGLADWAGTSDQASALAQAAQQLDAWVCVTRGAAPVLIHDGVAFAEAPAFSVKAVDTLGAGDVWHGAFALFLAEGTAPSIAVRLANAVAALKTTAFGGRDALPSREQLNHFLKEHTS